MFSLLQRAALFALLISVKEGKNPLNQIPYQETPWKGNRIYAHTHTLLQRCT